LCENITDYQYNTIQYNADLYSAISRKRIGGGNVLQIEQVLCNTTNVCVNGMKFGF